MKYYLILSAICFFDKIIYKKSISCAEEDFYFGKHGGILGESLYSSLNSYFS